MSITEAEARMVELMAIHGLDGWTFQFDTAVKRFGCCHYSRRLITLSRRLVELNDSATVELTMLHEIAHALVGGWHGHDAVWKRKARELGHSGNRTYARTVVKPPLPWIAPCTCPSGSHGLARRPRGQYQCRATRQTLVFARS